MYDDIYHANKILPEYIDNRQGERRKGDRRVKDGTPQERKDTADVLREGKKYNDNLSTKKRSFLWNIITLLIVAIITFLTFTNAHCESCQDPNTLNPQLKKTYYRSIEMCKEIGCTVSIRCYKK